MTRSCIIGFWFIARLLTFAHWYHQKRKSTFKIYAKYQTLLSEFHIWIFYNNTRKKYQSLNAECTIFFVIPSLTKSNKLDGLSTRDYGTYIAQMKNMICSNLSHKQTYIVWPWDLLIVIANANINGNWRRLNWIGTSVDTTGIRGSNIFSPWNLPFKIMALITFFINF